MIKTNKVIVDLHTHGTDAYDIIWKLPFIAGKPYFGVFQPRGDISAAILERCNETAREKGTRTLVGLANFDDQRAQRIVETLASLSESRGYDIFEDNSLLVLKKDGVEMGFLTGQEIITDKGDVLLMGLPKNINERKIEEVLKRARGDYDAIILGCHTGKPRSLSRKDLETYGSYFDAVDIENTGLPVYGTSDSHTPGGIFTRHSVFDDLDFTNSDKLKVSLRKELKKGVIIEGKEYGVLETARHLTSVIPWILCDKINKKGLGFLSPLKRDYN